MGTASETVRPRGVRAYDPCPECRYPVRPSGLVSGVWWTKDLQPHCRKKWKVSPAGDVTAEDIPPAVPPARLDGWDVVSRLVPEETEMGAHFAQRSPFVAPMRGLVVVEPPRRDALQTPEAFTSTVEIHPALDLRDPPGDSRLDLGVVREPVFFHLQLDPPRETELVAPIMLAARVDEPGIMMFALHPARPFSQALGREELAAEVFAPGRRHRLFFPFAPVDRQEFLLDGDRAAAATLLPPGEAEVRPPEILHGVEAGKDVCQRRGVRPQASGGRQDEVTFPAALDRRLQLVDRRMAATKLQAGEFAMQRAEVFFGVVFVVEHGG